MIKKIIKLFSNKINIKILDVDQKQNKLSQIVRLFSPRKIDHFKIKEHIIDDTRKFIKLHKPKKIISFGNAANSVLDQIKLKNTKKIFITGGVLINLLNLKLLIILNLIP